MQKPTFSLITATFNAREHIEALASDVLNQTDADFRWIVIDAGSTDSTTNYISALMRPGDKIVSERDFGIYDALNKGIRNCDSDYYIVAGADDRLSRDAIEVFRNAAQMTQADIIAAAVEYGRQILRPNVGNSAYRGQHAWIANHSISTAFRTSLHQRAGFYTHRLPICADQYFVRSAIKRGATCHYLPDYVAGKFSADGTTHREYFSTQSEFTRVQLAFEDRKVLQLALFFARCLKNLGKIV